MLVLSHRGYHVDLPENTLAAFAAAAALGVDGIETDLRVTADGQLILFHDRLTPDQQPISQVTRAELARLAGYDVPTAEEALERWPELRWNLEIKVPEAFEPAIGLIERYRATHRLLITSFWHNLIAEVSRRTGADCGLLISHRPLDPFIARSAGIPAAVKTVVWYYETMDRESIEARQQAGLQNFVYGVSTPAEHARCTELRLDGVITDRPEYCRRFSA